MKERKDPIYLEHILESIESIEDFSKGLDLEELNRDRLKKSAITRELEIIGEASKNLSKNFKERHNKIVWKKITGTRDIIIPQYFGVNIEIIFGIINKDLPKLKKQIIKIKKNL